MSQASHAIVKFIANLHPAYIGEQHDGVWVARSIEDGTLVYPLKEEDGSDGWVKLCWQGIKANSSHVPGTAYATIAVHKYISLLYAGHSTEKQRAALFQLAEHFEFKTGHTLGFDQPDELEQAMKLFLELSKKIGAGALTALLKSKLGL